MKLINYIMQNNWCSFKNNTRSLFYRSICTYGAVKYRHHKIQNLVTEDICLYDPKTQSQMRGFNGSEPQINEKSLAFFSLNDIDKYIDKYYIIRRQIEVESQIMQNDLLNLSKIKNIIDLEAKIYSYEYLLSGLGSKLLLEQDTFIFNKFITWKNDPNNKEPWIYNKIFKCVIKAYNLPLSYNELKNFITYYEFLAFLDNKVGINLLLKRIKQRKQNGYVFLNLHPSYWQNKVISRREIVKEVSSLFTQNDAKIKQKINKNKCLKGSPVLKFSFIEGSCIILNKPHSKSDIFNKIVVCKVLTAQDLYNLLDAKCIIVENGGLYTHASIWARQMNKPCIVGCALACSYLKNNDIVKIDGQKGIIELVTKK